MVLAMELMKPPDASMKHLTAGTLIAFVFTLFAPPRGSALADSRAKPAPGDNESDHRHGFRGNVRRHAQPATLQCRQRRRERRQHHHRHTHRYRWDRDEHRPHSQCAARCCSHPGSCDILHLERGPLNLDVLALVANLNRVVLDIDAQPGPGNLLGNLLCAVAGLLDNPNGLANLLNRILAVLG